MRIKALEERKQMIIDEQKKCQEAYNGIEKINEINESTEKSILEEIKKTIIALKDGDCKEDKINQDTWKKINDKIKEIDDIIQKKTIDEIQKINDDNEIKVTDDEVKVTDNEVKVTDNEVKVTDDEVKVIDDEK